MSQAPTQQTSQSQAVPLTLVTKRDPYTNKKSTVVRIMKDNTQLFMASNGEGNDKGHWTLLIDFKANAEINEQYMTQTAHSFIMNNKKVDGKSSEAYHEFRLLNVPGERGQGRVPSLMYYNMHQDKPSELLAKIPLTNGEADAIQKSLEALLSDKDLTQLKGPVAVKGTTDIYSGNIPYHCNEWLFAIAD